MAEEGLAYKPRNRSIIRLVRFAAWEDGEIGSLCGSLLLCLLEDNGSEEIDTREFNRSLVPAMRYQAILGILLLFKTDVPEIGSTGKSFQIETFELVTDGGKLTKEVWDYHRSAFYQ